MIITAWERARAQAVVNAMREVLTVGASGSDLIAPALPALPPEVEAQIRASAYGILAGTNVSEPWQALPFLSGCLDYGGGNQVCQFTKIGTRVELRGLVSGAALATVVFQLPPGYRPPAYENFSIMADAQWAVLVIQPDGTGYINAAGSATPENYASLAGIRFDTRP